MLCLRRVRFRAWMGALVPLSVIAIATSCSDDPTPVSGSPDSGAEPGQLAQGVCPDAAPEAGEGCVVPEGTTCSFGTCASASLAQCTRGTWRIGGNPPPSQDAAVLCPSDIPQSETACSTCFPAGLACRYGTCVGADATATVSSASCAAGQWVIDIVQTCPARDSGSDGASLDAGADVQGDADADVD